MATNQELQELRERIKRLEGALMAAGLPHSEYTCECCGELYMPHSYEDVRCSDCCWTCCKPRGSQVWVQGDQCPSKKKNAQS